MLGLSCSSALCDNASCGSSAALNAPQLSAFQLADVILCVNVLQRRVSLQQNAVSGFELCECDLEMHVVRGHNWIVSRIYLGRLRLLPPLLFAAAGRSAEEALFACLLLPSLWSPLWCWAAACCSFSPRSARMRRRSCRNRYDRSSGLRTDKQNRQE